MAYLFGDILAIDQSELIWMYAGVVIILLVFSRMWSALLSLSVNEDLARIDGIHVDRYKFVLCCCWRWLLLWRSMSWEFC